MLNHLHLYYNTINFSEATGSICHQGSSGVAARWEVLIRMLGQGRTTSRKSCSVMLKGMPIVFPMMNRSQYPQWQLRNKMGRPQGIRGCPHTNHAQFSTMPPLGGLASLASLTRSEQRWVSQRVTPKPKKLITFDRISPPNQFRQIDDARSC